jgi:hypothetical protein
MWETARQCWQRMDGMKQSLMHRIENYASLTIPKVCLPDGFDQLSTDQAHDYQSIGAQAVNHLTNKLMMAMFAPSRPFFRAEVGVKTQAEAAQAGLSDTDLAHIMAKVERGAVKELDRRAQRPKLYTVMKHLIIAGNVLLVLDTKTKTMRVMGLRYFCVKRDHKGDLHTLIVKECVKFNELEQDVQDSLPALFTGEGEVEHYRYIKRNANGDYEMTQWVNDIQLPAKFNGKWPAKKLPYRVLTWDLGDDADYGTGLVEEYVGDFEALSTLSEAVVDGAVLGTEYRWMVNPTGQTSADDLNSSKNGDALPGKGEDVVPTQGGNPNAITVADAVLQRYERRVATGFLMLSSVTRDAERVTAEEVRLTAQELETSFGGTYSTLAANIQEPVANWLLTVIDMAVDGLDIEVTIVTGLDSLSRNGDLENLRLALGDLAQVTQLPEHLQGRIKFQAIAQFVGAGRGIDLTPFIMSDQEYAQQQQAAMESRVTETTASAAGEAAVQQGTPQ